jgi:hypothetical protein
LKLTVKPGRDSAVADKITIRKGQEGSRWWNVRPSSEEVANWFKTVPIHEGMTHDRYVNGIVLIPQKTKTDEIVGENPDGTPKIREGVWNLTYTPYPKVETRVQYFHDLMAKKESEWMGVIEPIGGGENGLPPGFFVRTVTHGKDNQFSTRYLCCTAKVTVYERGDVQWVTINHRNGENEKVRAGKTIIDALPATKQVPLLGYEYKPDNFALMKAETGAVGRALGMAGMLVIPGAGVATADDMNEANAMEGRAAPAERGIEAGEEAKLPATSEVSPPPTEDEEINQEAKLQAEANEALVEMKSDFPGVFQEFKAWCKARKIEALADITEVAVLKGIVKKAQKDLDKAKAKARDTEAPEIPTEDETPPREPVTADQAPDEPTAE